MVGSVAFAKRHWKRKWVNHKFTSCTTDEMGRQHKLMASAYIFLVKFTRDDLLLFAFLVCSMTKIIKITLIIIILIKWLVDSFF